MLNVPFPKMVADLCFAIAHGQREMDKASVETLTELLATNVNITIPSNSARAGGTYTGSVLGLGILPTFYQVSHGVIEVKMAITMTKGSSAEVAAGVKVGWGVFGASVNAKYQNTYSYRSVQNKLFTLMG